MAGNIKVNAVSLGDSTTATQNFTLQTNVDGTAKLARGNVGATTQDILTVNAAGLVAMPQGLTLFSTVTTYLLGGARALGTTYTNTSKMPMFVNVSTDVSTAASISALVDGATTYLGTSGASGAYVAVSFMVPAGKTYFVSTTAGSHTILYWTEAV
jgi:hypothetical protein